MLTAVWMMLGTLLYSLQLNTGSFPAPLSEAEERYYLMLAKEGDQDARNILIERNLRLVAHIMKKYYTNVSDQEDLISIGTIGLIKGIETFDVSKGARLATYAARCVENAILSPETLGISSLQPCKREIYGIAGGGRKRTEENKRQGIDDSINLFPAFFFHSFDDCIQKFQLLIFRAVQ